MARDAGGEPSVAPSLPLVWSFIAPAMATRVGLVWFTALAVATVVGSPHSRSPLSWSFRRTRGAHTRGLGSVRCVCGGHIGRACVRVVGVVMVLCVASVFSYIWLYFNNTDWVSSSRSMP